MLRATQGHKPYFVNILSQAFIDNKSINFIVKDPTKIPILMEYAFDIALKYGEAYINPELNSCALLTFPNRRRPLHSYFKDIHLAYNVIGLSRIYKVIKRESLISKNQPVKDFTHLWFIGVDPSSQRKGLGSEMMRYILNQDHLASNLFYLETSTTSNIQFYKKFNFNIINEIDLGYKLFIMKKG